MKVIVSLLRGINVSGQKKVPMKELKALYEALGFGHVSTYIQSGNVIFTTTEKAVDKLPQKVERKIREHFGFDVSVIHRTPEELERVLAGNPFLAEKDLQENKLYVAFMANAPDAALVDKAQAYQTPADRFAVIDRETYLYLPDGYGNSKLHNNFFESKLKQVATTRNWRTVNILYNMALEVQTRQ